MLDDLPWLLTADRRDSLASGLRGCREVAEKFVQTYRMRRAIKAIAEAERLLAKAPLSPDDSWLPRKLSSRQRPQPEKET